MRRFLVFQRFVAWLVIAAGGMASPARAQREFDNYAINTRINQQAMERDIGEWAKELAAAPLSETFDDLVLSCYVCLRAGHDQATRHFIDAIGKIPLPQDPLKNNHAGRLLRAVARDMIRHEQWEMAYYYVERVEATAGRFHYVWTNHWLKTKTPLEVNRMLAARDSDSDWFRHRIKFARQRQLGKVLLAELKKKVLEQPTKLLPARRYVAAISGLGAYKHDISWMIKSCRLTTAWEKMQLAGGMHFSRETAIFFLQQSLNTPYTATDEASIKGYRQRRSAVALKPPTTWEPMLRIWTKESLMQLYKKDGQAQKAQKLLEELAKDKKGEPNSWAYSRFAGQVQASSGARVIQNRILKAEAKNKKNSDYWRGRGQYFAGRKEEEKALSAYHKALDVAQTRSEKIYALDYIWSYLRQLKRDKEAHDFAWSEYQKARDKVVQDALMRKLGIRFFTQHPDAFWAYLADRKSWYEPSSTLQEIVRTTAKKGGFPQFYNRAAKLAEADDAPLRDVAFGTSLIYGGRSGLAISFLKRALKRLKNRNQVHFKQQRSGAARHLFRAYKDVRDWRGAESAWKQYRQEFDPNAIWLADIAVSAAKAGNAKVAMQLWKRQVNIDRRYRREVSSLIDAGLRTQLVAFYQDLGKADPESQEPQRVLARMKTLK